MKREIYNDDLEQTLKEKTSGYRMYPSDKVWENIQRQLHPSPLWRRYLTGLLLLVFLSFGGYYLINRTENKHAVTNNPASHPASFNKQNAKQPVVPVSGVPVASIEKYQPAGATTIKAQQNETSILINPDHEVVEKIPEDLVAYSAPAASVSGGFTEGNIPIIDENELIGIDPGRKLDYPSIEKNGTTKELNSFDLGYRNTSDIATIRSPFRKRMQWEFYVTPSTSYRILFRNVEGFTVPNQSSLNVDQAVKHSPSLGFEIGGNLLFHLSKNLRLVAGAQLNYTRYNVNAYSSVPTYATVALNGGYSQSQSIRVLTSYRNFSGYKDVHLKNETTQLSIPLGMELRLAGDEKLEWNMGATLQPTYFLMNKGYMITNDLKNYINKPDFLQRLNLNTGIETSISWTMGATRWNAGPQIRYQVFSNYDKKYPFKEHIVDYGLKIGFTKSIK